MNRRIPPEKNHLCRFGPGGEYLRVWPDGSSFSNMHDSAGIFVHLGLALGRLAGQIQSLVRTHTFTGVPPAGCDLTPAKFPIRFQTVPVFPTDSPVSSWRTTHAPYARKTQKAFCPAHSHAPTTANFADHSSIPTQQWLFPDHAGEGAYAAAQPRHHIRARRNAHPKRASVPNSQQGSLFDVNAGL